MTPQKLQRAAGFLTGLWAGVLLGVGFIGAPAGFASTFPETAGRIAGRMFMQEAYLSLGLSVLLLLMLRRIWQMTETRRSVLGADALLLLGIAFCTVLGYFGLQPVMAAARAGQGGLSFGALHDLSMGLYAVKTLLLLVLAWRLNAAKPA
jgi:cytochrome b561